MIQLSALGKSFGARTLFSDVSLKLNPGRRYGLVGANGAGKTTFLKMLMGDEPASDGTIVLPKGTRLGVLRQDLFVDDRERIIDVCMAGDDVVFRALRALESDSLPPEEVARCEEVVSHRDGYTLQARASAVLVGLGLRTSQIEQPLGTLSGGFKLRVLLAQVLVGKPEVLLLDEPTNHLDILSIHWLEEFLRGYEGCAVVISHDQHFLNAVATDMLDVDYGTITEYSGNYDAFVRLKEQTRVQKEAEVARLERIVAEKRAFVERFKAKATKARQAQSRVKQIEKIEIEELPQTSRQEPHFRFEAKRKSGREVLTAEGIAKAYGETTVLANANLAVWRGERVGIIGKNGLGKSTLLKILVERLSPDAGSVAWGHEVSVGYFAQNHHDLLNDPNHSPLSYAWEAQPSEGTAFIRGALGRMLFSGDDVEKKVPSLSGGEAARLIFCRLMLEQPNTLVLDEPTNHLDLEAITALVTALQRFDGTVLFVSHDRHFVSALATRIIEVTEEGLSDHPGTYEEYLLRKNADHLDQAAAVQAARDERKAVSRDAANGAVTEPGALSWEERKRLKNRMKALPRKLDELLAAIDEQERALAELQARYAEPGFFERTSAEELSSCQATEGRLQERIGQLSSEWEATENELESLQALGLEL